jgi:hypothetical protein
MLKKFGWFVLLTNAVHSNLVSDISSKSMLTASNLQISIIFLFIVRIVQLLFA